MQWVSSIFGPGIHNTFLDIVLEENAVCSCVDLSDSNQGWALNYLRSTLKKEATLNYTTAIFGNRTLRQSLKASLLGEKGKVVLQGVWNLHQQAHAHLHVHVEHLAPLGRSLQKFKGVLSDTSQSSFEGKIYIHPDAQKTEAYQLNQNLLLGDYVIANTRPNLEIFADDVKASHGATVSQIDEESLFYLKSRALSSTTAKQLLIRGFIQEILDHIPIPSVKNKVKNHGF